MTFNLAELPTGWLLSELNALLDNFWTFYLITFNQAEHSNDDY